MSTSSYKFITALLNDPKLTASDRDRIIQLIGKELERKNKDFVTEDQLKDYVTMDKLEEIIASHSIGPADTKVDAANSVSKKDLGSTIHSPREIVNFLKLFSSNSSALKYTTHTWDKTSDGSFTYSSYDDFMKQCEEDFFIKYRDDDKNNRIYKWNQSLYYTIQSFLFRKEYKDNQKGWGTYGKNDIKLGYSYPPNVLKNWMDDNPDKQPGAMPLSILPQELRPIVNKKVLGNFEEIGLLFKKEIQFRGNDLYNDIKRIFESPDFEVNAEKLETLQGIEFYTSTRQFKSALYLVKDNIIARSSEHNRVDIYADIHDDSNEVNKYVDICINQLGSFSDKNINDDKLMLKGNIGQIGDIKKKLVSLCDFFIESRFKIKGRKSFARVEYLKDEDISREPEVNKIEDCDGFKYCFRFYL